MEQKLVQRQFSRNPEEYVSSRVHALGPSLQRLLALVRARPEWRVLDVATGGGHTAFALAPQVETVWMVDLTQAMLQAARRRGLELGQPPDRLVQADALYLPFAAETFDMVTCRIAPHHFPEIPRFLSDCFRVLRPGGVLAIVDNIVPGDHLRGRKAKSRRRAGDYVNALEKLRDPSHHRCLTIAEWRQECERAGIQITAQETLSKRLGFEKWANRMAVSEPDKIRLKAMLLQAPEQAAAFLDVKKDNDGALSFTLTELILIGQKGEERS